VPRFWTALALFAASLTPAILWVGQSVSWFGLDLDQLPVAVAVCTLAIAAGAQVAAGPRRVETEPRSRLRVVFRTLLKVTLALLWAPFLLDLLTARFGWTLLTLPACAALIAIARRVDQPQRRVGPWLGAALLAGAGPLAAIQIPDSYSIPVTVAFVALAVWVGLAVRPVQLPQRTWIGRAVAGGFLLGLSAVWSLLPVRADNGCTGVSWAFELALLFTPLALYPLGVPLLAEVISGPRAGHPQPTTARTSSISPLTSCMMRWRRRSVVPLHEESNVGYAVKIEDNKGNERWFWSKKANGHARGSALAGRLIEHLGATFPDYAPFSTRKVTPREPTGPRVVEIDDADDVTTWP
jgi:hypothetical protein